MKKQSILIVDDLPENIDALSGILSAKYDIKAATNGEQALRVANAHDQPDLILLDVMMPGMSGYDVCRTLKARKNTKEIPVIFITAVTEIDSVVKGFELGGVDYIVKPFNALELVTRAQTHLSLKSATAILKNQNDILEQLVERKTATLKKKNDQLRLALNEKDTLLKEVRTMETRLRESLNMLNRLFARFQGIQEEERKKIAADVHDRLGQLLTALKMGLFQIQSRSAGAEEKLRRKIDETIALADDAVKAAQAVSAGLRPDILDNLGFIEAVTWYCRTMRESSGVAFAVTVEGTPAGLDKEAELQLYRVIQEACTNVLRHARATACRVEVSDAGGAVRIRIRDDGVGIAPNVITSVDSLGLYGMRKRIDDIHGEFTIEGAAGGGTMITLLAPTAGKAHD